MQTTLAIVAMVFVAAAAIAGARFSILGRTGSQWWWMPVATGLVGSIVWALMAKFMTLNLVIMSAWFDALSALAWFAGFYLLGNETISLVQWIGITLLCIGLGLINWK
jgi:drug/metabolite transporter (DMT)-like permease